ncbi:MAG: DUF4292 domain-containing protein [Bacteroidota bacterium]
MKINKTLLAGLLLAATFSACKRAPSASSSFKPLAIAMVEADQLNMRSKVRYSDPSMSITANTQVRMKKDSVIWISITAMGFEAARAYITPDTMLLINKLNQEVMTYNFERLSRQMNFPVSFNLIQSALLGNLARPMGPEDGLAQRGEYYRVSQDWGPVVVDNFVDINNMKLSRIEAREETTANQLTVSYDNFTPLESFLFPYNGVISLQYTASGEPAETKITIEHNRVAIPEAPLKFPFSVPSNYAIR